MLLPLEAFFSVFSFGAAAAFSLAIVLILGGVWVVGSISNSQTDKKVFSRICHMEALRSKPENKIAIMLYDWLKWQWSENASF
jgi:hypothetical protein